MIDFVYPKNNEKEFISLAEKLNFSKLCFVYPFSKLKTIKKIKGIYYGCLCNYNELNKAKKIADITLIKTTEPRKFFENKSTDLIYGLELLKEKDFIHFRRSNLNQVLCKLAVTNKILIAFSFSDILKGNYITLGRIKQNIRLCKKYKIKTVIASFAEKPYEMRYWHDLASLFKCLGMKQPKQSFLDGIEKIKHNLKKKSPEYIQEGITLVKE